MGEAFLVRRGGVANFKGKQVVNVFVQPEEPEPEHVGDIWIVTDKPINNIIFRNTEPTEPTNMQGFIKVADSELKINIQHALEFLNLSGSHIIVTYPALNAIESISPDKIKLWANAYMEMFVRLGTMKYWDGSSNRWVYNRALYWTGNDWKTFSYNDYYPYTGHDSRVYKLDPEGNPIWYKQPVSTSCNSVAVDPDGCVYTGHNDGYVCKLDPEGNILWSTRPVSTSCNSVAVDPDGCVYTGHNNGHVRKLDPEGRIIWSKQPYTYDCRSLAVDPDRCVYTVHNSGRACKLDSEGNIIWSKEFIISTGDYRSVAVDPDGYIYAVQSTYVLKLDLKGDTIWTKEYDLAYYSSVAVDPDGCVYTGQPVGRVRKLDPEGNIIWAQSFGVSSGCNAVAVDPDKYVYTAHEDGSICKLDPEGNKIWQKQPYSYNCYAVAVYPLLGAFPHLW